MQKIINKVFLPREELKVGAANVLLIRECSKTIAVKAVKGGVAVQPIELKGGDIVSLAGCDSVEFINPFRENVEVSYQLSDIPVRTQADEIRVWGAVDVNNFPEVQKTEVQNFPSIQKTMVQNLPVVQKTEVQNFPDVQKTMVQNLPVVQKTEVQNFPDVQNTIIQNLPAVQKTEIQNLPDVQVVQVRQSVSTLKSGVWESSIATLEQLIPERVGRQLIVIQPEQDVYIGGDNLDNTNGVLIAAGTSFSLESEGAIFVYTEVPARVRMLERVSESNEQNNIAGNNAGGGISGV